jgi:hypothetical protein
VSGDDEEYEDTNMWRKTVLERQCDTVTVNVHVLLQSIFLCLIAGRYFTLPTLIKSHVCIEFLCVRYLFFEFA